jgi:hypothetical protein
VPQVRIKRALGVDPLTFTLAVRHIETLTNQSVPFWNDPPHRVRQDVMSVLDLATATPINNNTDLSYDS